MTDSTGNEPRQRGWYADPSGEPRQRWWDGGQWTQDVHDPARQAYGVAPNTALGPRAPVYSTFIWAIVLLPILTIFVFSAMDMTTYMVRAMSATATEFDPMSALLQVVNGGIFLGTIALAFFDRRQLIRDGFDRPFHWAWAILASGVYVIGRSVVVRRRAGRGLAPIWAWAAVGAGHMYVVGTKLADAMPAIMAAVPA